MRRSLVAMILAVAAPLAAPATAVAAGGVVDRLFEQAPSPPRDPCGATQAEKEAWREATAAFSRSLAEERIRLTRAAKALRKGDEARVKQEMAERYPEAAKADKAKLRRMSKEEKMAMVQKMMGQQGVAMPPTDGSPPSMPVPTANGAPSPGGAAPPGAADPEAARRHKELLDQVAAREAQGRARLEAAAAAEPAATAAARAEELAALEAELGRYEGDTIGFSEEERSRWTPAQRQAWADKEARAAKVARDREAAAVRYCARFGPAWRDSVKTYRAAVLAGRADYDRLEQSQAALEAAPGVKLTPLEPGLVALEALQRYDEAVGRDPFRFDLRRQPAGRK